ncbi:hypothetical protein [Comamonas terrigena]|uniref:hypothetical protein n=1 Tax=Comamonas terrigena TaxID=32013 RepID=UPI002449AD2E|nr:hypothetical protein [Comamonas terrigena]MDH1703598.1 hypothetical protein [Comamonas terrigena]
MALGGPRGASVFFGGGLRAVEGVLLQLACKLAASPRKWWPILPLLPVVALPNRPDWTVLLLFSLRKSITRSMVAKSANAVTALVTGSGGFGEEKSRCNSERQARVWRAQQR